MSAPFRDKEKKSQDAKEEFLDTGEDASSYSFPLHHNSPTPGFTTVSKGNKLLDADDKTWEEEDMDVDVSYIDNDILTIY